MVDRGSEWSDICCWIVGNVAMERDESKEILVYEFLLGVPKFLVILVDDCVLVRVVVVSSGTGRDSKELGEKSGGNRVG